MNTQEKLQTNQIGQPAPFAMFSLHFLLIKVLHDTILLVQFQMNHIRFSEYADLS